LVDLQKKDSSQENFLDIAGNNSKVYEIAEIFPSSRPAASMVPEDL